MRKTTEYKAENRLTVDIEGLMAMLSCGEVTAKKIADYAEARVIVGRRVLYNVDKIKKYIDENNLEVDIEADGGINIENAEIVKEAGANILVSGSAIINATDYKEVVNKLKE